VNDPVVATVVWLVVWLVLAGVFTFIGMAIGMGIGAVLEFGFDIDWAAPVAVAIGYTLGLIGVVWAVVQVILHIIDLLRELGIIHA
jgi:hypothetical protein